MRIPVILFEIFHHKNEKEYIRIYGIAPSLSYLFPSLVFLVGSDLFLGGHRDIPYRDCLCIGAFNRFRLAAFRLPALPFRSSLVFHGEKIWPGILNTLLKRQHWMDLIEVWRPLETRIQMKSGKNHVFPGIESITSPCAWCTPDLSPRAETFNFHEPILTVGNFYGCTGKTWY